MIRTTAVAKVGKSTYGSRSQTITISSSLPLANHRPECAQRTVSTGPVCIESVHSDFGGLPDASDAGLRIGFVLQMRTLASRPPVAIREPSGCTCTENIERRFGFESPFAESLCITHAGLVKCMAVRRNESSGNNSARPGIALMVLMPELILTQFNSTKCLCNQKH